MIEQQNPQDRAENRPRWRKVARSLVIVSTIVVLLAVAGGYGTSLWLEHRLGGQIERLPLALPSDAHRPAAAPNTSMNILLMGSDKRADGSVSGQRSDTMMVVHVAADRKSAGVVGIPRDSWVQVPGHGPAKINAAFSWGGPALAVQTVENLTDVRIDHVAVIDWEGFKDLTDALGGVTVRVHETVTDGYTGRVWTAGRHRVDGEAALAYVRQRAGLPGGDFDRIKRQQSFLRALSRKVLRTQTFVNPPRMYDVLDSVTRSLSVDEGWTSEDLRKLAWSLRSLRSQDVAFTTVPLRGTGMEGAQSVVYLDRQAGTDLWDAVRDDDVVPWIEAADADLKANVN